MYACMYVAICVVCVCVCVGGGGVQVLLWGLGHRDMYAKDCFQFEIHDFSLFLVRTLANIFWAV